MDYISNLRKQKPIEILSAIVRFLVLFAVLAQFGRFSYIAFSRIAFPFSLEWMEGGSFVQVSRILSGQPLYVRPSFDFIPQIYPPVYFYTSALVSKVLGNSFFPLRLVSILSTLGILFLIYILVYQQSGSKLGGILASGLFCATYELSGHWFDIARVDSLALVLLLLSAYLLLKDNLFASIFGGIILALSFFTKQTMLISVGVFLIYCLLPPRKNSLIFIGTTALAFLGGTLLLDWLHEGWYSYYIFHLPGRHRVIPKFNTLLSSTNEIFYHQMVKPVFFAAIIGFSYLLLFPERVAPLKYSKSINKEKISELWLKRTVWILLIIVGLLAISSFWYLASLPSDAERGVIGSYSLARLLLMLGPVAFLILALGLARKLISDSSWTSHPARQLFGKIQTVPRLLIGFSILTSTVIIFLANIRPGLFDDLNTAYLQRLLPYLVIPVTLLIVTVFAWRLLWKSNRLETWFYLLLVPSLVAVSWLGRLNPGGYYNVFMPAYAGISILFGLGIGHAIREPQNKISAHRSIISILVLLLSGAQLISLFSPSGTQIPTQADKEAGIQLVNHIKACPKDVYVPFHTYLAEMAGKPGYAGVVEMGELRGSFGGRPDPLWGEVSSQIQRTMDIHTFANVIQDNKIFRDAMSPNYIETGQVFKDELVFWPVTGRKIRPEFIYQSINTEECLQNID